MTEATRRAPIRDPRLKAMMRAYSKELAKKKPGDRGFLDSYKPQKANQNLIKQVKYLCMKYEADLPLTLRQLFYLLVANFEYPKTESSYTSLSNMMKKARRAQMIPMNWIRDDGFYQARIPTVNDADDAVEGLLGMAKNLRLDRQRGQEERLMLWCEARGMVPVIEGIGRRYGVRLTTSGGFDSVTAKHNFAKECAEYYKDTGIRTVILHVGDYDPSGELMFRVLEEDIFAFAMGIEWNSAPAWERIALTPEQIDEYELPSDPAKSSTHDAGFTGEATQLEALEPDTLRSIVESAIEERMDMDLYEEVLNDEEELREEVTERLTR